jgi:hypothetical protein
MTLRQAHYTSSRHGRDGIHGFQITAASSGLTGRQEELGLRLASYRPPPSAPPVPTEQEIERFPVAFGYRSYGDFAVLFCSRYLGADFTGRQGNYFAHLLVADDLPRDLGGSVPAAAWGAPLWTSVLTADTELPTVEAVGPGPGTGRDHIRSDLVNGGLPLFTALLSALPDGLGGGTRRIIVVAPSTAQIAAALLAASTSLPEHLVPGLSFTTFSSTPTDVDVLVAGTTPDVPISAGGYGEQVVVRSDADPAGPTGHYAALAGRLWLRDAGHVAELVELAGRLRPPLDGSEIEHFADAAELLLGETDPTDLLAGMEFMARRPPGPLTVAAWSAADRAVAGGTELGDLARWSSLLAATHGCGPVLEAAYLRQALTGVAEGTVEPSALWLPVLAGTGEDTATAWALSAVEASPSIATVERVFAVLHRIGIRLAETDLRTVTDLVVLPLVLDPATSDVGRIRRLPQFAELASVMCAQLDERIDDDVLVTAVQQLSPDSARLLAGTAPVGTRCALVADLALARIGEADRIRTLRRAAPAPHDPVLIDRVVALLWAEAPGVEEAVVLSRAFPPDVLPRTRLAGLLVQRLRLDAAVAAPGRRHIELARQLGDVVLPSLAARDRDVVEAVRSGALFSGRPAPSPDTSDRAVVALQCGERAEPALRDATLRAVASWLVGLDTPSHLATLEHILRAGRPRFFLDVYAQLLVDLLATAAPARVAAVLPVLAHVAERDHGTRTLLDSRYRAVVSRRRKRDLDEIGRLVSARPTSATPPAPGRAPSWASWWDTWLGGAPKSPASAAFGWVRRRRKERR